MCSGQVKCVLVQAAVLLSTSVVSLPCTSGNSIQHSFLLIQIPHPRPLAHAIYFSVMWFFLHSTSIKKWGLKPTSEEIDKPQPKGWGYVMRSQSNQKNPLLDNVLPIVIYIDRRCLTLIIVWYASRHHWLNWGNDWGMDSRGIRSQDNNLYSFLLIQLS